MSTTAPGPAGFREPGFANIANGRSVSAANVGGADVVLPDVGLVGKFCGNFLIGFFVLHPGPKKPSLQSSTACVAGVLEVVCLSSTILIPDG